MQNGTQGAMSQTRAKTAQISTIRSLRHPCVADSPVAVSAPFGRPRSPPRDFPLP
jgi:hypothetical protein